MKLRIKFAKHGAIRYIGHLDVMRFFQKAIRRAGIDIKYSEGFSPHPVMSFASPLGVGMESFGEYLDIEVNSITSTQAVKAALNAVTAEGIDILSVKILPDNAKNAMASVAAAGYKITPVMNDAADARSAGCLNDTDVIGEDGGAVRPKYKISELEKKLALFYAQEQIFVNKKTKKSETVTDIKQGIYGLKLGEVTLGKVYAADADDSALYMLVNASSSGNIKPSMALEEFCRFCNMELPPYSYMITRLETYMNVVDESGEEKLLPLEEAGHE